MQIRFNGKHPGLAHSKKVIWFRTIPILLFALIFSCQTDNPAFYLYREHDITIPAGLNTIETHFFVVKNISNAFQDELEARQINPDQIKSVNAGQGIFEPIFQEFDYGIIRDVSIWLVSVDDPTLRKEIYYRDAIPFSQKNELKLLSGIADLKSFLLEQKKYNLEIQLKFRNFVPSNFENRFTYSFAIFME